MYKKLEEFVKISTNEPEPNNKYDIYVGCNYLRSCFGAALSILNQCTGTKYKSIREELQNLTFDEILLYIENRRLNDFTLPVPKELHTLLDFILEHGKYKPNIFLTSGNASLAKNIREKIDTN